MEQYYIGQIFEGKYPPAAAFWCNANNAYIEVIGDHRYEIKAVPPAPAPTHEDIAQIRAQEYQAKVDPITAHISRLRDKEQTEEVVAEIAELIAERDALVEQIKAEHPYPDEPAVSEMEIVEQEPETQE